MTINCDAKIIAEYRNAGFNRRLHIYLEFPHLRSNFIQIDQGGRTKDYSTVFNFSMHSFLTQLNMKINSAASSVKRVVGVGSG